MNKMKKFSEIMADPEKREMLKAMVEINILCGRKAHFTNLEKVMDAELKRLGIRKNESQ